MDATRDGAGDRAIGAILAASGLARSVAGRSRRFERLAAAWAGAAGEDCMRHTADLLLKDGVLRVTVDAKAWEQELILRDLDALAGGMAAATGLTVARIRIRTRSAGGGMDR